MHTQATPRQSVVTAERDRTAGDLTASEVRAAVARFLTPGQVAALAHAALDHVSAAGMLAELRSTWHGCAGGGVICTGTRTGVDVEITDTTIPAGLRAGAIPWRLVARVVADGGTPERVAALDAAITTDNVRAAHEAADAIVLAGPSATQLDLLDHLAQLADPADLVDVAAAAADAAPGSRPKPPRRPKRSRATSPGSTTSTPNGGAR